VKAYFFSKITHIYYVELTFTFIHHRIYVFKLHYFYVISVHLLINCVILTLRNVKYQFNTKYSNNHIIRIC